MPSPALTLDCNSTVATISPACFTPSGPTGSVFEASGVLCAGGCHGAEPSLQCSVVAVFPPAVDPSVACSVVGALPITEPSAISLPPASVARSEFDSPRVNGDAVISYEDLPAALPSAENVVGTGATLFGTMAAANVAGSKASRPSTDLRVSGLLSRISIVGFFTG
ncbi:uncharacterized protein LOC131874574 isoform X2 [Cryptomeria japonica]|uniref:uncharacterized protein LOC131874574 isoform X2 n=1 Tax=Cryptomeria japonica TaxID=3369 RepID=UPI0027DA4B1D|nr:uncharacterized protein LOC131874574 isoform X2 [Cryptomeria japonica]